MENRRILVIDDDADTLLLLKSYLLQIGFAPVDILTCKNYKDVTSLDQTQVEIVVTDLGLPDSQSSETLNRIKQLFPEKPVIVVTAAAEPGLAFKSIVQGAEDYLEKQRLTKDVLERAIRYALLRAQGATEYRKLFDENPAPMFIVEHGTYRFLAVNNAALWQYGYSREEFLKLSALDIRPSEDREAFLSAYRKHTGQYENFGNWRHRRKNGSLFYVQVYSHSITFQGKMARLVMTLDMEETVTAKLAFEQKAKENENILHSITDGFFSVDTAHRLTYVNRAFEKLLQKSKEEVLGKVIWDVFPETIDTAFYYYYHKAIDEKRSMHFEALYPPLQIWLSASAYPSETGLTAFFIDVTDQKRMQEAIYLSEQNLRASIDNTDDLIWSVDKEMNIISANVSFRKRMKRITGQDVKTLERAYFNEKDYQEWIGYYARVFSGEKFKVIRTYLQQDAYRYEDVRFNPMYDQSGQIVAASCFSRDITEQQQHIMMIEEQNEKLRQINWFQSHELRKPVANILGLAALINKDQLAGHPEMLQLLEYMEVSARELDQVIRKIIDTGT